MFSGQENIVLLKETLLITDMSSRPFFFKIVKKSLYQKKNHVRLPIIRLQGHRLRAKRTERGWN